MDCICIEQPGVITHKERPMPERKKGEALLKLLYGGICGSDLGTYRGTFAYSDYPRIPGHEFSAEIVEIDENQLGLEPGMIVTANPYFNCGQCYSCRRGLVNCCENNETMGAQRDGAFCQYISIPVERLYPGEGIEARHLALIEPFCIGYHGMKKANVKKGEKVLIIGAGTIGITAGMTAKLLGGEVHICDVAEGKLEYARHFGFDEYVAGDFLERGKDLTFGSGYDVVAEAVGLPETFQSAVDAAAFGGRVIQIGVGKQTVNFNFTLLQKKELTVYGSRNAVREDFAEVIGLVQNKTISLDQLITHTFPLSQCAEAFRQFDHSGETMLKVMIQF